VNIIFKKIFIKDDLNGKKIQEESLRRIERGGKILIGLHSDTGCILQMPRGNLELIHPRTLVISKLKSDINK
jgi:elongator complex protein 1